MPQVAEHTFIYSLEINGKTSPNGRHSAHGIVKCYELKKLNALNKVWLFWLPRVYSTKLLMVKVMTWDWSLYLKQWYFYWPIITSTGLNGLYERIDSRLIVRQIKRLTGLFKLSELMELFTFNIWYDKLLSKGCSFVTCFSMFLWDICSIADHWNVVRSPSLHFLQEWYLINPLCKLRNPIP